MMSGNQRKKMNGSSHKVDQCKVHIVQDKPAVKEVNLVQGKQARVKIVQDKTHMSK